jgi:glyoxylase-like metal-dependent hydrolase (beta-lactamase superfamily II)
MLSITSNLSRRSLFKATALGAGALAAPQLLVRTVQADVPTAAAQPAAFKRFSLGDFEITVLSDGHRLVPGPHNIFGTNTSEEEVTELLKTNYLPVDKMQFTFAPTLVNTGNDLVLFDTGNGEGGREGGVGQTLANLKASGYTPEQVTVVVLTHLHGDHIGGLMEGGAPTFPNARYITGQAEYDFWSSQDRIGTGAENGRKGVVAKVVPLAEKMSFIGDGETVVTGITSMAAFGHTPGHMIYGLESGDRKLLLTADTANHFVLSLQRPDWEVVFDTDKAMAAKTRKAVFDMLAAERLPFIGYHMPFPSVGFIEKASEGYRFIPETYQFDL